MPCGRTIARRLVEAKQTIPHFYLVADVDIDFLLKVREGANAAQSVKISINDFIIKAFALALQRVPDANAVWAEDSILRFKHSDVGVAVAIEGGLFTPVIRKAETKSLSAISAEMKDLAARARERKLLPHEYSGGVGTISNLGMYGVREFSAIINPPQSTILAVGASQRRAVETSDGESGVRHADDRNALLRPSRRRWRTRRSAAGRFQSRDRKPGRPFDLKNAPTPTPSAPWPPPVPASATDRPSKSGSPPPPTQTRIAD